MTDPVAETTLGSLQGTASDGVLVFKGIPYAAAPVGTGRFRPPTARAPWTGVREATAYGPSCPQAFGAGSENPGMLEMFRTWGMHPKEDVQDEDCLVLNLWTPALTGARPVMFRIHGGGFAIGSGSWAWHDGANLVRRGDVVVVTVNHRLGALGYLYLDDLLGPDYAGSGNAGMLDLVAALEWVRDNIAAFGGDPGNVTVFGESGGGYKTSILLAMPPARGLFHRAIVQSGPGLAVRDPEGATATSQALLDEIGVTVEDPSKLGELPVQAILDAERAISGGGQAGLGMSPVRQAGVIPADPGDALAAGDASGIPVMVGTMRHEATMFLALEGAATGALPSVDETALLARVTALVGEGAADLVAAYRAEQPDVSAFELLAVIQSDQMMRRGSVTLAERKLAGGGEPVYTYLVTWKSPAMDGFVMASHGLCVPLTMDNTHTTPAVDTPEGREVANAMSEAWLAFARTGNPDTSALPEWPHYSLERRATMVFDLLPKVVDDPFGGQLRAWPSDAPTLRP
jgi:para-nitrobenzyl esterase